MSPKLSATAGFRFGKLGAWRLPSTTVVGKGGVMSIFTPDVLANDSKPARFVARMVVKYSVLCSKGKLRFCHL